MSQPQQPSIRSFFQPRPQPAYAAPPSSAPPRNQLQDDTQNTCDDATKSTPAPVPPPPAPPLPPTTESPRYPSPVAAPKSAPIPITLPPTIPVLPSPPSLPSGATIVPLEEQHIPALRRINALLLPVAYPDSFYSKVLDPLVSGLFSRAILWQDSPSDPPKLIGGLVCRLEPNFFLDSNGQPLANPPPPLGSNLKPNASVSLDTPYHAIYIQSLALLSPYRSLGLAAAALEHIIASATLLPAAGASIDARTIYAHVWTENEEGLKWYESRRFSRDTSGPVKGYYFKLRPDTAWIVSRHIGPGSSSSIPSPQPTITTTTRSPLPPTQTNPSVLTAAVNLPPMGSLLSTTTTAPPKGPPRKSPITSPSSSTTSLSYQNTRPEMEWNDLPAEMVAGGSSGRGGGLAPPPPRGGGGGGGSGAGSSATSSRSSSRIGKKKERAYPSAAFGQQ
ncbi:hypothetical protein B0T21DRAFT_365244 [Apiosordaria backusii]|uniref:N-acetyltransferase domain-containing protein n=1 Tax=Apiosordaria backusii TaxID=314023 RepID=A0AA40BNR1_9PEZI|nr:hypothetical protein B0T21DRAFT_365244 [Apiosordaria backusii]